MTVGLVVVVVTLFAGRLPDGVTQAADPSDRRADFETQAVEPLTSQEVEARLAAVENDAGLDDATKDVLRRVFQQALDSLAESERLSVVAVAFRNTQTTGPAEIQRLRTELEELPTDADATTEALRAVGAENIEAAYEAQRTLVSQLDQDSLTNTREVDRVRGRPALVAERLATAQRELSAVQLQLRRPEFREPASTRDVAEKFALRALESKLANEVESLTHEQQSQATREELLAAQSALQARRGEIARAVLDVLEVERGKTLAGIVRRVRNHVDEVTSDAMGEMELGLATELNDLVGELDQVVAQIATVGRVDRELKEASSTLAAEFDSLREQLGDGVSGPAASQVLLDLRRRLIPLSAGRSALRANVPGFEDTRFAAFEVTSKIRHQSTLDARLSGTDSASLPPIVLARREVLELLDGQYRTLIRRLASLESDQAAYEHLIDDADSFAAEQLLWSRNSPRLGLQTLTGLPAALQWVFSPQRAGELGRAISWVLEQLPVATAAVVIVCVLLTCGRLWIGRTLESLGQRTRRISTDSFSNTLVAVLLTVLLAAPLPMFIGYWAWALGRYPQSPEWLAGFALGLWWTAHVAGFVSFWVETCRPHGLGAAHYRWPEESLSRVRRVMGTFPIVFVPSLLVASCFVFGTAVPHFDSLGRTCIIIGMLWTGYELWWLARRPDGLLANVSRAHPASRWYPLWFSAVVGIPLLLAVLAILGYTFTALFLGTGFLASISVIGASVFLCSLSIRWFALRIRRQALVEALERRRERRESQDDESGDDPSTEVVEVDEDDIEEQDLATVGDQTRDLLRLVFGLGVFLTLTTLWSEALPLVRVLESVPVPLTGGLTLLDLGCAVLVVVATYMAFRNLPGLMEAAILRSTDLDAGARFAVTTILQYALLGLGIAAILNVLHVDTANLGWIAAALSVGLGFGLQEVVANFVCGIILLLERPIRLGDVVTVDSMTGTVTRIHIRSTTITNWDRQEFVVPNKTLITGNLLNWTLNSDVTRIVVPVGVAYGSDTELARRVMLELADEHPNVMDDPAPLAAFEAFADSTLNLRLLAYVPSTKYRLSTITDLHTKIGERFAEAGIEIAFPQRDVHVHSVPADSTHS